MMGILCLSIKINQNLMEDITTKFVAKQSGG
jgi:hypothetical protein